MSALSDLQKKLEKESQGIMFPFSANASTVSTTQNVYDSATDGIMTMTGQKYVGPDAVVQYGTEEQGYPRQLKQIEAPMLPQFDATQFPKAGEGIMQTPTPAPTPPVETEPEAPAMDPCPPGFKFDPVKKVCVPIEQPKEDRNDIIIDRRRNIGDTAQALGQVFNEEVLKKQGVTQDGTYQDDLTYTVDNNIPWLSLIPIIGTPINIYQKNKADKQLEVLNKLDGVSVTQDNNGKNIIKVDNKNGKLSVQRALTEESLKGNIASTQKTNSDGSLIRDEFGRVQIQGPISMQTYGKVDPLSRFEDENVKQSETSSVTVDPESTAADAKGGAKVKLTGATEPVVFGELPQVKQFGQLVRNNFTAQLEIKAALDVIKQYETLYETGRINFGDRDSEIERQKDKIEEATKLKQETDKQIEEIDLGDNIPRQEYNKNDNAQQRRFKEKVEEKRIQNEVKKFQAKQKTQVTKPDKARTGERQTLRL